MATWMRKFICICLRVIQCRLLGQFVGYADYSLFTFYSGTDFLAVLVYIDDLVIAWNNTSRCTSFKSYLNSSFKIKDLGPLKFFLGIEITHTRIGLFLSQRKYTLEILEDCGLSAAKLTAFPIKQHHRLASSTTPVLSDPACYRRLIGRLLYLTITRPELCYSVYLLAQFMHKPRESHWDAAIHVLHYLKHSPGQGIFLSRPTSLQLIDYCNSDWSGELITSYVPTKFRLADIFTKALGRDRFHFLLRKLGIRDLHALT
ncbi:uncharacterized mitochondrial protein AtMg00810-like [Dioscorea cayenensis subsp. rotundata]|uniref:Uncharacterized mitochondrial protein AtMg00810-like n=1 Tax=Dioscorea cayennensis subsp. rotundata TaxID=55577 RepID=A0AB40CZX3_DIOCR|nr:uncharacterized mitochondrial protein AtMg00810-like [Dioscorea cayenensis subsp. rotundata]